MKDENSAPDWLNKNFYEIKEGELVDSAKSKAKVETAAKDVVVLCVGNLFVVLLSLLAPIFKFVADSGATKNNQK